MLDQRDPVASSSSGALRRQRVLPVQFDRTAATDAVQTPARSGLDTPEFADAVAVARRVLPAAVDATLTAFGDERLDDTAAVLISGVPTGAVPATPTVPGTGATLDRVGELWLLAIARAMGQPVGYLQEQGGDLVQNLVPVAAHAHTQTSTSSAVTLAWHTETAFHPHRPRWLIMLALRGDPSAATRLVDVRDLVASLDSADVTVLREPRFTTGVDASFGASARRTPPAAVLWGPNDNPRLWFDADLMRGEDVAAQAALHRLCEAVEAAAVSVVLDAGDCLVIDNTRAAHGRTPFAPRFDGSDRWLQRALVVADLAAIGSELQGRVITTRFD